jgi:hypothetical protein
MASRLYPATVGLFCQVLKVLVLLGLGERMSALWVQLACLYVCGLIALDTHQTNCRIARFLPARCHDALNRLLRKVAFSTASLMALLVRVAKTLGEGYLILDDVVVEKFGAACPLVGYCWSTSQRKVVLGLHIVVVVWCSCDGRYRILVGWALWKPKERCAADATTYRTKIELGKERIVFVRKRGFKFAYLCFDGWYAAGWFVRWLTGRRIGAVTQLPCDGHVVYGRQEQRVDGLAERLQYRRGLEGEADYAVATVTLSGYGPMRLVVTREEQGTKEGSGRESLPCGVKEGAAYEYEYLVTNDLSARGRTVVRRKQSRWKIETVFRDDKQSGGLGACQCRVEEAVKRHVGLSLLTFVVLQWLRETAEETVGEVKERWQLEIVRQGHPEPKPLRGKQKVTLKPTA